MATYFKCQNLFWGMMAKASNLGPSRRYWEISWSVCQNRIFSSSSIICDEGCRLTEPDFLPCSTLGCTPGLSQKYQTMLEIHLNTFVDFTAFMDEGEDASLTVRGVAVERERGALLKRIKGLNCFPGWMGDFSCQFLLPGGSIGSRYVL